MLVDETYITVKGGKGGAGCVSFFPGGRKTGPDGGNGGNGGSVYVVAVKDIHDLYRFKQKPKYEGQNGENGMGFQRAGAGGVDIELRMPTGTTLIDQATRETIELVKEGDRFLLVQGGIGGRGNEAFKSSTNQAPRESEPGTPGEEKHFKVIMKLIADYGFIGLPNAGKSSLLNELTAANVRTANYPFTTLEPNLGVLHNRILADIPGLIEGASSGKGLGFRFLKHIEKVQMLFHCISLEAEDIEKIYKTVMKELETYNPELAKKEQVILLTKHDIIDQAELKKKIKIMKKYHEKVLPVSIYDLDSINALKKFII